MEIQKDNNYLKAVQQIKTAILQSRYEAAALANKELLKKRINKFNNGNNT